ncbi:hypothetical protein DPMN_176087 [Dreissena polymorpha]|uniref:Uncharacterized protein n=1 Tax=Dreissena polymorpha TaxID=45954 RepID=A0A9D4E6A8_DREPO|nr:hypothetical protein DPMN_176087 [Dreissena polymorpha]
MQTCPFGDQPGAVGSTGLACPSLIKSPHDAYLCYQYETECCKTCRKYDRNKSLFGSCQYGDRLLGCEWRGCHGDDCCDTCGLLNMTFIGIFSHTF